MIYLTILNTVFILYIFFKQSKYFFKAEKKSSRIGTLLGFRLSLWKRHNKHSSSQMKTLIHIPIRNGVNTEMKEDAVRLISESEQNKRYSLRAIFSWCKSWDEVRTFQKYYTVVDSKFVHDLVREFVPKN